MDKRTETGLAPMVRTVRIVEAPAMGWVRIDAQGMAHQHRTAILASKAQRRADREEMAATGRTVVTVITWEYRTTVGAAVVRAITGEEMDR